MSDMEGRFRVFSGLGRRLGEIGDAAEVAEEAGQGSILVSSSDSLAPDEVDATQEYDEQPMMDATFDVDSLNNLIERLEACKTTGAAWLTQLGDHRYTGQLRKDIEDFCGTVAMVLSVAEAAKHCSSSVCFGQKATLFQDTDGIETSWNELKIKVQPLLTTEMEVQPATDISSTKKREGSHPLQRSKRLCMEPLDWLLARMEKLSKSATDVADTKECEEGNSSVAQRGSARRS